MRLYGKAVTNAVEHKSKSHGDSRSGNGEDVGEVCRHFVPPDATIADLEKKAAECEQKAATAEEAVAAELRKEAVLCREWVAALRSGRWTS